jgi:type IV fimbrial biogenesis protein FimT
MDSRIRGFTLLELLTSLGLAALLTVWGLPMLSEAGRAGEAAQFSHIVTRTLMTARRRAVASGERVTLCASTDQQRCVKNWLGEVSILVFTDRDSNFRLDQHDTLHLMQALKLRHGKAYWRGSLGRPYLRFRSNGSAVEYGRFSYCPQSGDTSRFRQLVINRIGRVYLHYDGTGRYAVCG